LVPLDNDEFVVVLLNQNTHHQMEMRGGLNLGKTGLLGTSVVWTKQDHLPE